VPEQRQRRENCGEHHLDGLRHDHNAAVVEPVGDDAGEQAEQRERAKPADRQKSDGKPTRVGGELDDDPCEPDVLHPGAGDRRQLAGEEEAVVPVVPERGERPARRNPEQRHG